MRKAMRLFLSATHLARIADVEHERRTTTAVRMAERDRARRKLAAASIKLDALVNKLRDSQARAAAEHVQRTSLAGMLRHYLLRLARVEADMAETLAAERRVMLAQMSAAAKDIRSRAVAPAAAARAAHLASRSPDYAAAVSRWRSADLSSGIERGSVAGLRWSVPGRNAPCDGSVDVPAATTSLPLEDLALIRRFAVGGVMLDVGAGIGATSIPRVVLGDFAEVCAAEPDPDSYLYLVGNTLDNNLEGRVLPDRVVIAEPQGADVPTAPAADRVPTLTLDEWVERLRVDPDDIRLVRLARQEWGMPALRGARQLLGRRHIVWQVQLSRGAMPDGGTAMADLCGFLAAHFSHIKELGGYSGSRLHPIAEADAVLRAVPDDCTVVHLLLFNVSGNPRRGGPRPVRVETAGGFVDP